MQTLLVTGASGFIGANLIEKLRRMSEVYKIVALSSKNIDGVISINHNNYAFTENDFIEKGILGIKLNL